MAKRNLAIGSKAASTSQILLDAAHTLIIRKDSLNFTFAEISKETGLNSSLIKYYFGDKNGMLFDLWTVNAERNVAAVKQVQSSHLSPTAKMQRQLTALMRSYYWMPYGMRLATLLLKQGGPNADSVSQTLKTVGEAYAAIIKEGVKAKEFRNVDPTAFYFVSHGACLEMYQSVPVLKKAFGIDAITEDLRRKHVEMTVAMIMSYLTDVEAEGKPQRFGV